jgi:hypothetical protein
LWSSNDKRAFEAAFRMKLSSSGESIVEFS